MFDQVRIFGLTNRPAGYAQVPDGWERVEQRTPDFAHGTIRYDRALTQREMYSFELTPIFTSPRECAEAMLATASEALEKTVDRVKAGLREDIAAYTEAGYADCPPSYPIGTLAEQINRKVRIWPLGQYKSAEVFPAMVALLAE